MKSQDCLRPGLQWSQMAEACVARASWGLLRVWRRGGVQQEGPRKGWGVHQSREELRPPYPHSSPGTGSLGSAVCAQEMARLDYRED